MTPTLPMTSSRSTHRFGAFFVFAAAMAACTSGDPSQPGNPSQPDGSGDGNTTVAAISPQACLRKAALDLTEKAPSPQDFEDLKSQKKSFEELVDGYLDSPAFSQVAFQWFYGTFEPTALIPAMADKAEPARIAQYLITNDLDFRALLTADYTVGSDLSKQPGGPAAAGVLSTQAFLSAYTGLENRNWAGRILRGMLGIFLAPVSNVPEGTDSSKAGLAANPACAGCHVNPLYGVDYAASFHDCFDTQGLPIAGCQRQTDSQFLGQTGRTLPDLGRILAGSVEWRATTIQTFYAHLAGRQIGKNELSQYRDYEDAWVAAGYKPKALLKQIVTSSQYCSR